MTVSLSAQGACNDQPDQTGNTVGSNNNLALSGLRAGIYRLTVQGADATPPTVVSVSVPNQQLNEVLMSGATPSPTPTHDCYANQHTNPNSDGLADGHGQPDPNTNGYGFANPDANRFANAGAI